MLDFVKIHHIDDSIVIIPLNLLCVEFLFEKVASLTQEISKK